VQQTVKEGRKGNHASFKLVSTATAATATAATASTIAPSTTSASTVASTIAPSTASSTSVTVSYREDEDAATPTAVASCTCCPSSSSCAAALGISPGRTSCLWAQFVNASYASTRTSTTTVSQTENPKEYRKEILE